MGVTTVVLEMSNSVLQKDWFSNDYLVDGSTVQRKVGNAKIRYGGRELIVPVVLGEKNDDPLLGVTTLESFGLMVDPFERRIYPSKLML